MDEQQRAMPGPLPATPDPDVLAATRIALHRLAAYVIAPTRHAATGRFGLRATPGGFGTPPFPDTATGAERRIRVEGTTLVDERLAGGATADGRTAAITTLAQAAGFLDTAIAPQVAAEHDTPPVGDPDEPLIVDPAAADFLGAWFAMAFAALEALRADPATVDPSPPQLWPGHFDPAIEAGDGDHRASYGASPGDPASGGPYLYVSIWYPDRLTLDRSEAAGADGGGPWNATSFTGAILPLDRFPPDADPAAAAAAWFTATRDRLDATPLA